MDKLLPQTAILFLLWINSCLFENIPDCYETAHIKLAVDCVETVYKRNKPMIEKKMPHDEKAQLEINKKYIRTAEGICGGIEKNLDACKVSAEPYNMR